MNGQTNTRQRLLAFLAKRWWILLILIPIVALITGLPILRCLLYALALVVGLCLSAPVVLLLLAFLFSLFSPAFMLMSLLRAHFRESAGESKGKRYFFIPAALLAVASFATAQCILVIWVFVISLLIWSEVLGFLPALFLMFGCGLAPLAVISAPIVAWVKVGFVGFWGTGLSFLIATCWWAFSKMAFTEDYSKRTPDKFLGYSPHTFLLGALSFQVIALPLYQFGLFTAGNIVSNPIALVFLLLALASALKWHAVKRRLSAEERAELYKPPVWIYIFGVFLTNLLYDEFHRRFDATAGSIYWLNGFFFVAMMARFVGFCARKIRKSCWNKKGLLDMTANEKLKRVLVLVGGTLILGCLMFPPWVYRFPGRGYIGARSGNAGYHWLFYPPEPGGAVVQIDLTRLVIQCAAISLVLWLAYYLGKRPISQPPD